MPSLIFLTLSRLTMLADGKNAIMHFMLRCKYHPLLPFYPLHDLYKEVLLSFDNLIAIKTSETQLPLSFPCVRI